MLKRYFVHKYLLLQLIIGMIIISITISAIMIHFYFSSNFEGALYMLLLLLLMTGMFIGIIFIPIFMLVAKVEIDGDKITVKNYRKIIAELFWTEKLTVTEKMIGGAKYLVIAGENNKTILFCYSKKATKHILSVCTNEYILNQLN